ncbi:MAG: AMP-binding protein [Symploca sp. SIO2D2]|nr:AMP-binding protein [Symploca sp. SIO2D2]
MMINQNSEFLPQHQLSSIVEILNHQASTKPNSTAYIFLKNGETESNRLTYGELDKQARAIASHLQSFKGERALLLYPSGLEFLGAFFGCLYAGVIAVPVYPPRRNQKLSRLLSIVDDAQVKVALTTTSILADFEKKWAEETELSQLKLVATDTIENKSHNFVINQYNPANIAFLQYTSGSTGTSKGVMVTHGNIIHNQQMIQMFTKHTEKSTCVSWLPLYHDMGLGNAIQAVFIGAQCIIMPPVAFLQHPKRWLQAISHYQAHTSGGPNFAYDLCIHKVSPQERQTLSLGSWRVAFNGAEPIQESTLERFQSTFFECGFQAETFLPCYGLAESTAAVTTMSKKSKPIVFSISKTALSNNIIVAKAQEEPDAQILVSSGKTCLAQTVVIVEPASSTLCRDRQVGEIWVGGPSVAAGYWNRPEATKETFQAYLKDTKEGPFLRTGDLGFIQNGELFVTGRLKDLIIIRGRNYYPQYIELTIANSHPALRKNCGAAFSVEIEGTERLVVVCELERTSLRKLNTEEVVKGIRRVVSAEHDLQVYAVLLLKTGSIPKTSSGKIQRHACRTGFLNESLNVVGEWKLNLQETELPSLQKVLELQLEQEKNAVTLQVISEQTSSKNHVLTQKFIPTEEELKAWLVFHLARNLNVLPSEISVNESFADYGLDSSVAVSTTGDLAKWLGYELEPTLFWEYPNIKALALYLAKESKSNSQVTVDKEVEIE